MNSRQVQSAFRKYWERRVQHVPAYRNDKPAKRQAFSVFVDDLARDGAITERVASNVDCP